MLVWQFLVACTSRSRLPDGTSAGRDPPPSQVRLGPGAPGDPQARSRDNCQTPVMLRWLTVWLLSGVAVASVHAQPASAPDFGELNRAATQSRPDFELAAAVPADALVYFEASQLDQQFESLLNLLRKAGITDPLQFVQRLRAGGAPATQPALPGAAMFLSPGMIDELRKTQGASLAILDLGSPGRGERVPFLSALRFGGSDALHTCVSLLLAGLSPTVEPRDGWTLHQLPDGVEVGLFERTVVIGWPEGQVESAIRRPGGGEAALVDVPGFRETADRWRQEGGVLAYVQWPQLARVIHGRPASRPDNFAKAGQILSLDDLQALWAHVQFGEDTLSARIRADWKTGAGAAYRLLRSPPLDRTILEYVPADSLGCVAMSVGQGQARFDSLVHVVAAARGGADSGAQVPSVREEMAKAQEALGIRIAEQLEGLETVAVGMLPPDVPTIARREGPATTRPATPVVPTMQQILRSSLFVVAQVKNADAFDRLLDRIALLLPSARGSTQLAEVGAATQPSVTIDRVSTPGGERRTYRVGDDVRFHVIRRGELYVLAGRPEVADAAVAARDGRIPHLLAGRLTGPVLASVPAEAGKILLVRLDSLANLMVALRTLGWGFRGDRPLYAPVPTMKPAVVYTLEEERQIDLAMALSDLPVLVRHLLQTVPRPPSPQGGLGPPPQ